jgi:transposase
VNHSWLSGFGANICTSTDFSTLAYWRSIRFAVFLICRFYRCVQGLLRESEIVVRIECQHHRVPDVIDSRHLFVQRNRLKYDGASVAGGREHAFNYFGGVFRTLRYDNMTSATLYAFGLAGSHDRRAQGRDPAAKMD